MNRDDIIRMAQEAGVTVSLFQLDGKDSDYFRLFQRFATLVAAAEREEIMILCHEIENDFKEELGITGDPNFYERMLGVVECIDEIRARGNND